MESLLNTTALGRLRQHVHLLLWASALFLCVCAIACVAWLYPTVYAPWVNPGQPIDGVHIPESVLVLTRATDTIAGTSTISYDMSAALELVRWVLLAAALIIGGAAVISFRFDLMMCAVLAMVVPSMVALVAGPTVEAILIEAIETLDRTKSADAMTLIGVSPAEKAYILAQMAVLIHRQAKTEGRLGLELRADEVRSAVHMAGDSFIDAGRLGMKADVLLSVEREAFGRAISSAAQRYEVRQMERGAHYASRPPIAQGVAIAGGGVILTLLALAWKIRRRASRVEGLVAVARRIAATEGALRLPSMNPIQGDGGQ